LVYDGVVTTLIREGLKMKFYVLHLSGDMVWGFMNELGSFSTETEAYQWIAANVHMHEKHLYKVSAPF
jgi:hypothetical protein